jgi:hypothetical protein
MHGPRWVRFLVSEVPLYLRRPEGFLTASSRRCLSLSHYSQGGMPRIWCKSVSGGAYLTESAYKFVLQQSIPTEIRQLVRYISSNKA